MQTSPLHPNYTTQRSWSLKTALVSCAGQPGNATDVQHYLIGGVALINIIATPLWNISSLGFETVLGNHVKMG